MSTRLDRAKTDHEAIHQILLHEWDPIGVAHEPAAHDEYDSYIHEIHEWQQMANILDEDDDEKASVEGQDQERLKLYQANKPYREEPRGE